MTPLADASHRRQPVAASGTGFSDTARLTGTLTHRLLQRHGFDRQAMCRASVRGMLRPDESEGSDEAIDAALSAYRALCARADVRAWYDTGERLHEVPFTMCVDGSFVRGSIDCLVRSGADRLTVLEFKTGRPRDEHQLQLDLYRRAAEQLFPGCTVEARLVYADEVIAS